MIALGLTGSIGMGKSTTAAMFAEHGVPVWDADATVHALYGPAGGAVAALAALAPGAVGLAGVDRTALRAATLADPGLLPRIEAVVHPLVAADRAAFLARARDAGAWAALCDIPLLYETGAESRFDAVIVVTAGAEVQQTRVLARPGMTAAALAVIRARQMPDADKCARADYVIHTDQGLDAARAQVAAILEDLRQKHHA